MRTLIATLLIGALAGSVRADPPSPASPRSPAVRPMTAAARPHYDRGAAAYQAGAYAQAIEAFERGQRLDPHPDFLYALAQVYRRQGDCQRAIALYQAFLATHPPDNEAERARANLERCPLAPSPPPSASPSPDPSSLPAATLLDPSPPLAEVGESPWYTDAVGGVLVGAGLIGAGVGTTYLIVGNRAIDDARRADMLVDLQRLAASGSHDRLVGALCLAGGGALVLGGVVRYALHRRASPAARSIAVTPAASGAVVSWGGRF